MESKISPETLELRTRLIKIVREDFSIKNIVEIKDKLPDKYKVLLDSLNGFIAVCNYTTGLYEYISEGIRSYLGYDLKDYNPEQLTNLVFSIIYQPHSRFLINTVLPSVLKYFKENATSTTITDYRFTCCAKLRNVYDAFHWYLMDTAIIEGNEDGYPLRTLITCTNIHQFKHDEGLYFNIVKKNDQGIYQVCAEGTDRGQIDINLTPREIEIVNLIGQGYTNKQIAHKLFISLNTVQTHRKNIMKKTKCSGTAELVNFAFSRGLL